MEQNSEKEKSEEIFIQNLMKLFGELDQNELKKDIDKAKNLKAKTIFINEFLQKYSNSQIDNQTSQQMLHDIISNLILIRKDFVPFMEIYITIIDEIKAEILKNHFILKEKKLKKIENKDTNFDNDFIKFGVSFSCIFDEQSYYKKFVHGIFLYFKAIFKENYLYEYIEQDYFLFQNKFKYYEENFLSLIHSLNNMLVDINRVIFENSKKQINKDSDKDKNKMTKTKFEVFLIKFNLHHNKEIINIYDKCKNNDEILIKLNNLLEIKENGNELWLLTLLIDKIEKFMQEEKNKVNLEKIIAENTILLYYSQKQIRDLTKETNELIYELREEFKELKNEHNYLLKEVNKLETKYEELDKKFGDLRIKIDDLDKKIGGSETKKDGMFKKAGKLEIEVKNLKERVDFLEPMILSLSIGKK